MVAEPAPPPKGLKSLQQRALLEACADLTAADRIYRRTKAAVDRERAIDDNSEAFWEAHRAFVWALREWSHGIDEVRRAARAYTQHTRRPRRTEEGQDGR